MRLFCSVVLVVTIACSIPLYAADSQVPTHESYAKSLHYTNRGLAFWYAKENGGLERITGVPFSQLKSCNNCHVQNCETCHAGGKVAPTKANFKGEAACDRCHEMETQAFARKNPKSSLADVHFARGMKCLDCHTSRDVHGDGTPYVSMQSAGAVDVHCERCHTDVAARCPSNAVHGGKLDCNACHVREVSSCVNCHFDTKIKHSKSVSLPMSGALLLLNKNGKVTVGNIHTFVYQNRTMIVFAPAFPHSIMREGRKCVDCHGAQTVRDVQSGALKLVRLNGKGETSPELINAKGIVPVVEGFEWNLPFLNYENGKWLQIETPAKPLLNYAGYAKPLTKEQLAKMAKERSR
ncbi:MAG TPA: hypothetical protein VF786_11955 [Terriglobales bacterium]